MVIFVFENKHSSPFVISDGPCVVNDNNNTSLNDHFNFSVTALENMNKNKKKH